MQTFFSAYPGGKPAVGLLLLRFVVGIVLIAGSAIVIDESNPAFLTGTLAFIGILTGISLVLGFLTPLASILAALCSCTMFLQWLPITSLDSQIRTGAALLALVALSLAFLGPGAFSIDSRLFGPREITIPQVKKSRDQNG
jgi:uncharacterized membrane protein YphA (DoxX/SURF4 family)